MRQRLYEFLQALYEAQETGQKANVPPLGQILIRQEDYAQPERKPDLSNQGSDGINRKQLGQGLQYAQNYFSGLDHHAASEHNETQCVRGKASVNTMDLMNSAQEFVDHENAVVDVEDSPQELETRSRYFPEETSPQLDDRSRYKEYSSPQEAANDLRNRRESMSNVRPTRDVIDLSSPVKPQKVDDERARRGRSVSTDFLTSDDSYDQPPLEHTINVHAKENAISHMRQKEPARETVTISDSQSDENQQGQPATMVIGDGQSDPKSVRHAHKRRLWSEEEGYDHGEQIYARTISGRDVSIVPESLPSTQVRDSSIEIQGTVRRHTDLDEMLLK